MKHVLTKRFRLRLVIVLIWLAPLIGMPATSLAATIVGVQTNIGSFKLELYEDVAPTAVARFLENVEARRYHFTMLHHALGATIRGGLYLYNSCFDGPEPVTHAPNIAAIENGLENKSGTIALVRNPDDPTELTNEWMIGLATNPAVFDENNPPIVIGEVVEGLDLLRAIDENALRVSLAPLPPLRFQVPTVFYPSEFVVCGEFTQDNLIRLTMNVESVDDIEPINSFDVESNQIRIKVDAGSAGLLSLAFQINSTEPQGIIQVLTDTVTILDAKMPGMASFNESNGELLIPQLYIGSELAYQNVLFTLSNAEELQFTLLSFELP